MKFGDSLWQRSVPQWRSYNIDYGSIKNLIKEQTTPGKGKAISVPGHAATIAEEFEDQLLLVFYREHDRVSRFVKSKWYEINSRLGSIERQLHQVQRRKDGVEHLRDTIAVRNKAARIESDILNVGEEIQHLSRFISSNRLAIRKLLKKYRKWTGLTTLAPKVESKIINQPGSFTKMQLDYALDLYTAYLEAVRSPFRKPVPRQLSAADLAQHRNITTPGSRGSITNLFSGSDLDFDLALAAEVRGEKSQSATFWVHKDNAVELRILLLQYMGGVKRRASSASLKSNARRASADEIPSTIGTIVIDNSARVAAMGRSYESPGHVEGFHATASARWNANGQAVFAITNPAEGAGHILTHPAAVQFPRQELASFLDVDAAYPPERTVDDNDNDDFSIGKEPLKPETVRAWLRQHQEIEPLVYTRCNRARFVGLENQTEQAAWAAFDEDVEFGEVRHSDLLDSSFFVHVPRQGVKFPHAILTVRTEGDCSNLFGALNESHLTERVKGFSVERHALATICQERGMPKPSWYPRLDKDIRQIPQPNRTPSRRSSNLGLSSAAATPKKGSRSGASDSEALSVRFEEDHSESTRVDGNTTLKSKSSKSRRTATETASAPQEQRYWNEYDNPEDGDENPDGEFYIYIDPDAPLYPGQRSLQAFGRRLKSAFQRSSRKRDAENGSVETGDDGSISSSEDDDDTATPSGVRHTDKSHRTPLVTRATQTKFGYGALPLAPGRISVHAQRGRTTALCLLAAAIIFAILNVLAYTGRRKTHVQVNVAVLLGVIASIAFVGTALGVWLREPRERHRTKKGVLADAVVGVVAALIGAGDAWLLVSVLT